MPQLKYWQELYDLKSHSNYVDEYLRRTTHTDRLINMSLAISSSTSIGAWVVWQQYGFIWGGIIATSHVLNAIKPFLPYKSRMKVLSGLSNDLEELFIQAEMKWYEVSQGVMTAGEINKLQFEIRSKKHKIIKKYLDNHSLPVKPEYLKIAEDSASQHFNNYYKE